MECLKTQHVKRMSPGEIYIYVLVFGVAKRFGLCRCFVVVLRQWLQHQTSYSGLGKGCSRLLMHSAASAVRSAQDVMEGWEFVFSTSMT